MLSLDGENRCDQLKDCIWIVGSHKQSGDAWCLSFAGRSVVQYGGESFRHLKKEVIHQHRERDVAFVTDRGNFIVIWI